MKRKSFENAECPLARSLEAVGDTWSVLIVELAVPVLIWFRETRRLCLLLLLVFHLGNEWTMHLFLFHWIMLCGWLSFVTNDDLRWFGVRDSQGSAAPRAGA